jgi:predicted nucleotidyltransferase
MDETAEKDTVRARIQATLRDIAQTHQVQILYACESGSRAWEFASPDSDFDVRFIYARPAAAYLELDSPRDVIERPLTDDLDINGWDIFKALRLLRKGNPPLLEWLASPIIYLETPIVAQIRDLARQIHTAPAIFYHYRQMAHGNYHQHIEHQSTVLLKKYLYVLRPVIALCFLEEHQTFPPTSFLQALSQVTVPDPVRAEIAALLTAKQAASELGTGAAKPTLNAFLENHLARWENAPEHSAILQEITPRLNELLREVLAGFRL